jgi:membrane associated rhomboid family serine protease
MHVEVSPRAAVASGLFCGLLFGALQPLMFAGESPNPLWLGAAGAVASLLAYLHVVGPAAIRDPTLKRGTPGLGKRAMLFTLALVLGMSFEVLLDWALTSP